MNKKVLLFGLSTLLFSGSAFAFDYSKEVLPGIDYTDILIGGAFFSLFVLVFLMIAAYNIITGMLSYYGKIALDKTKSNKGKALLVLFALTSLSTFAAGEEVPGAQEMESWFSLEAFLIMIIGITWVLIFTLIAAIRKTVNGIKQRVAFQVHIENGGTPESFRGEIEKDFVQKFTESLTDAVPIEHEESIMMNHEYDGIRELDNNLPPWWKYGFYVTIVVAVVYLYYYHLGEGPSSAQEYAMELKEAEESKAVKLVAIDINENNVTLLTDPKSVDMGAKLFSTYCKSCHGQDGGGGDGPNFTDQYWIHGGGIKDIFKTIKYGVEEKGMTAWGKVLDPLDIQQIASFVYSLEGTTPQYSNKEPQGTIYDRSKAVEAVVVDTVKVE